MITIVYPNGRIIVFNDGKRYRLTEDAINIFGGKSNELIASVYRSPGLCVTNNKIEEDIDVI